MSPRFNLYGSRYRIHNVCRVYQQPDAVSSKPARSRLTSRRAPIALRSAAIRSASWPKHFNADANQTNFLARFWPSIETNTRQGRSTAHRYVAVVDAAVMAEAASQETGKSADEDRSWNKLAVTFQASPDAMLLGHPQMSAAWRLFLFGNGSPTHHLGLLTGSPTEVDVLGMLPVGDSPDNAPSDVEAIAAPRCRRQVWLRNARGERLGYAASWISVEDVGAVFKDTKIPIGKNILQHKTELYRDMKSVFCGHSAELEEAFGAPGPFWGRSYLFWNGGRPVTFIYEVFSPTLEKYMGQVLQ